MTQILEKHRVGTTLSDFFVMSLILYLDFIHLVFTLIKILFKKLNE